MLSAVLILATIQKSMSVVCCAYPGSYPEVYVFCLLCLSWQLSRSLCMLSAVLILATIQKSMSVVCCAYPGSYPEVYVCCLLCISWQLSRSLFLLSAVLISWQLSRNLCLLYAVLIFTAVHASISVAFCAYSESLFSGPPISVICCAYPDRYSGVYIDGEFGIRLETVLRVARIKLPYDDKGTYLFRNRIALVPTTRSTNFYYETPTFIFIYHEMSFVFKYL
jgi:hypothetical protein